MPREIEILGVLMPALLPIFVGTAVVWWLLDTLIGCFGGYQQVWHPPLFRLCLFVCLFVGASWTFIQ